MLMELVKLLLTRLKLLLVYRAFFLLTVIHLLYALLATYNYSNLSEVNDEGYISNIEISGDYYKYYVNNTVIYSKDVYNIGYEIKYQGQCSNLENRNFTDFDYMRYLKSNNISCILFEPKITLSTDRSKYYAIKYNLSTIISKTDLFNLKQALVVGNKSMLSDEIKQLFYDLHLSHILALSGLHISVIIIFINRIAKKLVNTIEYVKVIEVITVTVYGLLVFMSYSIIRTLLIYYIMFLCRLFKVKVTKLTVLLIVVNILLINNYVIFSYSFIYSFLCYFIIILCLDYQYSFLKLYGIILLFTLPITINLSNQLNLVGLVFAPFITIVFEVIYFPYILITTILGIPDLFTKYFISGLQNLNSFKLVLIIKDLTLFTIVLYYITLLSVLKKHCSRKIGYIMLSVVVMIFSFNYSSKQITIVFFDVGQGDATLFLLDDGLTILLDSGGSVFNEKQNENLAKYTLYPFLKERGIAKLDYVIITHGDKDHMGSLGYLLADITTDNLYINCNSINELERTVNGKVLNTLSLQGDNYRFDFSCKNNGNENDSSIVTKAKLYNTQFISMGDMSSEYEVNQASKADIYKVSHHGSNTSTSSEVVEIIDPTYAIISVGINNYGHPSNEVLNNLGNLQLYRTDLDCAVMFEITADVKVKTKCNK